MLNSFPILLASRSPRRKELLTQAGYQFTCCEANINETPLLDEKPTDLVLRLSSLKAKTIQNQNPNTIIIGSDTMVTLNEKIYGKPQNRLDAIQMLQTFSEKTQQVITGVCILHPNYPDWIRCITTEVTFKKLTIEIIKKYFALVNPLDKAGAYGIQSHGNQIIASISGSLNNVIGLPTEAFPEYIKSMRL
ncbi:MAG: nucleoside triphosphate pyrophosphatase [Lentisphaeria bacterium]